MPQKNNPFITVLSSFTKDILLNEKRDLISTQSGGPALFIKRVFDKENINYDLRSGPEIIVEILVTDKGEFGKIKEKISPNELKVIAGGNLMISTLFDEWPLMLKDFKGNIFIDVQGFIRDWGEFGKKKDLFIPTDYQPFCVKGTDEEISHINSDFINEQKQRRCLIITRGKNGSTIFYQGKEYVFTPAEIISPKHTLGAGDTFFANFIAEFLRTSNIKNSGDFATQKTIDFLKTLS